MKLWRLWLAGTPALGYPLRFRCPPFDATSSPASHSSTDKSGHKWFGRTLSDFISCELLIHGIPFQARDTRPGRNPTVRISKVMLVHVRAKTPRFSVTFPGTALPAREVLCVPFVRTPFNGPDHIILRTSVVSYGYAGVQKDFPDQRILFAPQLVWH